MNKQSRTSKQHPGRSLAVILLVILLIVVPANLTLAGAPDETKKQVPQGGTDPVNPTPPTEPGESSNAAPANPTWQEYPPYPNEQGRQRATSYYPQTETQGGSQTQEIWPPFLADIFGWTDQNLNPGKWASDSINGALAGMLRALIGGLAQPVYFLFGREVPNPYLDPEGNQQQDASTSALGANIVSYTPPEYTYSNGELMNALGLPLRSAALAFLSLILCVIIVRELVNQSKGQSYGFQVGEMIRRIVIAIFLAVGGYWWIAGVMIRVNNILINIIFGGSNPGGDLLNFIFNFDNWVGSLLTVGLLLETSVAILVTLIVLLILGGMMATRIILIQAILVASPLFAMTYAADETEHYFQTFLNTTVSVIFFQFISMIFLKLSSLLLFGTWGGSVGTNSLLTCTLCITAATAAIAGPTVLGFALMRSAQAPGRAIIRGLGFGGVGDMA